MPLILPSHGRGHRFDPCSTHHLPWFFRTAVPPALCRLHHLQFPEQFAEWALRRRERPDMDHRHLDAKLHVSPVFLVVVAAVLIGAGLSWFWFEVLLPAAAEADLLLWVLFSIALVFYVVVLVAEKIAKLEKPRS